MHGHDREVAPQRLPVRPVIERHPHAVLGAGEEQPPPHRILPHHPDEFRGGDPGDDLLPGAAVIRRAIDVRGAVLQLITVRGEVSGAGCVVRRFDAGDPCVRPEVPGRHVLPCLAAIASDVHEPVIGARPDQSLHAR